MGGVHPAEQFIVTGTPQQVAERLADYVAVGTDTLPVTGGPAADWRQTCDLLAETRALAAGPSGGP